MPKTAHTLDARDQLESRLARVDAMLQLMARCPDIDAQTLQTVALDAADHIQLARQLCQILPAGQQKGPAHSGQPLGFATMRAQRSSAAR